MAQENSRAGKGEKIAIVASFSGMGGVERMISNLCQGLCGLGAQVDLLLIRKEERHGMPHVEGLRIIPLKASHNLTAIPEIASYLRRERPRGVLAAKDRAIMAVAAARRLARTRCRVVGRLGTTVSAGMSHKHPVSRLIRRIAMRWGHSSIDATICVSQGVAKDLASMTKLPIRRFPVVPNPVITPDLEAKAHEAVHHPWFTDGGPPIILSIGRLTRQKGFDTLIRAFAALRTKMEARLMILGEGGDRQQLEKLAAELGVAAWMEMPGFVANPYPFLFRAQLFVLSSRWEGSPNALTEALALGIPVVATDCPSGPREILQGGERTPLVPVDDVDTMAKAMLNILNSPPDGEVLKQLAAPYTQENSSRRYLEILLHGTGAQPCYYR